MRLVAGKMFRTKYTYSPTLSSDVWQTKIKFTIQQWMVCFIFLCSRWMGANSSMIFPKWQNVLNGCKSIYCVLQKERVRKINSHIWKCPPYLQFYFWFKISSTLCSLCKQIFWINQFEDEALNMDTSNNHNSELCKEFCKINSIQQKF